MDYVDERFEWDIAKSDDCYRRRHFDFEYASRVFDSDYWNICVGRIDDQYFTVVYTPRGIRKRIIAAWLADDDEIKKYAEYFESAE